jgi:RimJ/RimL family protein N-acetyltransferase
MNIRGKRILLRAIETHDLPLLHQWANNPDLASGLGDIHFPSSAWQQERWFERIQASETTIRLAIQICANQLIGYTGFWNIHWRDRRAEHAVLIGDSNCRGQGYGREAILTCARYAFEEMELHRLDAYILESNIASLKSYQACGFQIEGTLREHALRGGRRINRLILGLLAEDYAAWVKQTAYWEKHDPTG